MDVFFTTYAETQTGVVAPIPHLPLLLHTSFMPLLRPQLISLQQLPPHCTGNTAKKSQAMSMAFNPYKPPHSKNVTIQDSLSDSSSDSDSNSDPLNYWSTLPVVMKMNGEGIFQTTITAQDLYQTAQQ